MTRASSITTLFALLAFIVSGLLYAFSTPSDVATAASGASASLSISLIHFGAMAEDAAIDVAALFLRPDNLILWLLLIAMWAGLIVYGINVVRAGKLVAAEGKWADRATALAGAPGVPTDNRPIELAPIAAALLAGAVWPWVSDSHPVGGFLLAAAMLMAALTAAIRGQREGASVRLRRPIAVFAGWATAVTFAAFASLLTTELGASPGLAAMVAVAICAAVGMFVQVQIGASASYSITLIWGLVGLAISSMASHPNIAVAAVLGVTAMIVMLVRAVS